MKIFVDEPVPPYKSSSDRRKSVFVEPYNPEDDDGDDTKVIIFPDSDIERFLLWPVYSVQFVSYHYNM